MLTTLLVATNVFLVLLNGALAGHYITKGKNGLGYMNLAVAVIWATAAVINTVTLAIRSCQ